MYCHNCGKEVSKGANSCSECGLSMAKSDAFSPYNAPVGSGCMSAATLISIPTLVLFLSFLSNSYSLKYSEDEEGVVTKALAFEPTSATWGYLGVAVLCLVFGIIAGVMAKASDAKHTRDDRPGTVAGAKSASLITTIGLVLGAPAIIFVIGSAFVAFASGEAHGDHGEGEPAAPAAAAPAAAAAAAAAAGNPAAGAVAAPAAAAAAAEAKPAKTK